jgi:hypothetical protein
MTDPVPPSLWQKFHEAWLSSYPPITDPRLAADAGVAPVAPPRYLSPLVGAWLH